jgi:undecaprenyl-diphosphatase
MSYLFSIDYSIFYFFNTVLANPVFDFLMPIITNGKTWLPIYALGLIFLLWKGGIKGRYCAALLVIGIIVSDQTSSSLIKKLVGRERPCHERMVVRALIGCPGGKSFPSSHSLNNFCAATILAYFFSRQKKYFYSIAALIAFTRVYCGVHYPSDIFFGAIFGCMIGYMIIKAVNYFLAKKGKVLPR